MESQLVTPQQLKGHLALLRAFHALRQTVQAGNDYRFPADVRLLDADRRWTWFVSLAVERFERWCLTIQASDTEWRGLPPIDVAMVWHAYLLNPSWYAEDTTRISKLKALAKYNEGFSICLDFPDLLTTEVPRRDRVETWKHRTGTPYHPFDAAAVLTHKHVECPRCSEYILAAFVDPNGMGYAQGNFKLLCTCGFEITKASLGLYKFAKNLVETNIPDAYLAGSLHTPRDCNNTTRAGLVKSTILQAKPLMSGDSVKQIMEKTQYDRKKLHAALSEEVKGNYIERTLGAYTDDRIFSIDLIGAVSRQASFVEKMADLGWTQPGFFDSEEDAIVLQHCIARYQAFLGLMKESQASMFVPTLDIDLAWHTHQLMARRYQQDCFEVVGHFVNHDDKLEEGHLATSFDVTCRVWKERYGLSYMYCGCPLPDESIGRRLRRTLGSAHNHGGSLLAPSDATSRPATHNAVFAMHRRAQSVRAREERMDALKERRAQEAHQHIRKNTTHRMETVPSSTITVDRGRQRQAIVPALAHVPAFLHAIPMFHHPHHATVRGLLTC
ncbi:hypothetical protein PAXINDRAFT_75707 [Paxillus involutus ATCC 200175]|nr:hypothetical protein PAXINDRAFT_75707 [Paxillus involutus ATCC 200175]